ncbi:MAG: immunoglobulin-like domain-containing protein, partial [Turicibacter sp.]
MKKISFLGVLLMMVMLVGCSQDSFNYDKLEKSNVVINDSDVLASIKENNSEQSTNTITLVLENKTQKEYLYGAEFSLEIENEGQWYIVPFNESAAFIEIGYMLDPYKTNEEVINLSYFKELP